MPDRNTSLIIESANQLLEGRTRRQFLKLMALGGSAVLLPTVFTACDSGVNLTSPPTSNTGVTLDLSSDTGVLNYAYALEQLEAAFYTQAVSQLSASNLSVAEQSIVNDVRNHEVIHRNAFAALLGSSAIGNLSVDFSGINFTQRTTTSNNGVLQVASVLEDTGVSAYNGAGQYLSNATYLTLAGKIVSVEARHASAFRDLLSPGTSNFSSTADSNGLDPAQSPSTILAAVKSTGFVTTQITLKGVTT